MEEQLRAGEYDGCVRGKQQDFITKPGRELLHNITKLTDTRAHYRPAAGDNNLA